MNEYKKIDISYLVLDEQNPRIPKAKRNSDSIEMIRYMWRNFSLEDLIISIRKNGFISAEPLMVIPNQDGTYVVVEGNRRLAALKLLTDDAIREKMPEYTKLYEKLDIAVVPCVLYSSRTEVQNALAVRHISGIKKWETREKAEFIANLYKENNSIKDIVEIIGSKSDRIGITLFAYKWIEYLNEEEANIFEKFFEDRFSLLILALGQKSIRDFIGIELPWSSVNYDVKSYNKDIYQKMKYLCTWLDDNSMIKDSRQITGQNSNSLTRVLSCDASREYLIDTTANNKTDFDGACLRINVDQTLHLKFQDLRNLAFNLVSLYKQSKDKGMDIKEENTIKIYINETIKTLSGSSVVQ